MVLTSGYGHKNGVSILMDIQEVVSVGKLNWTSPYNKNNAHTLKWVQDIVVLIIVRMEARYRTLMRKSQPSLMWVYPIPISFLRLRLGCPQ